MYRSDVSVGSNSLYTFGDKTYFEHGSYDSMAAFDGNDDAD